MWMLNTLSTSLRNNSDEQVKRYVPLPASRASSCTRYKMAVRTPRTQHLLIFKNTCVSR